jgi:hypothetical protein
MDIASAGVALWSRARSLPTTLQAPCLAHHDLRGQVGRRNMTWQVMSALYRDLWTTSVASI